MSTRCVAYCTKTNRDMTQIKKFVEQAAEKRAELIESFIVAYLIRTGTAIEDVELVESVEGSKVAWYLQRRPG